MKRIFFFIVTISLSISVIGQTTYDWLDYSPDGNWKQGDGGARWNPGGLWDQPDDNNILRFNNNHQLSMTNNVSGYYIHQLIFGSNNTSNRSIGGNDLSFSDNNGNPKIENQSTGSHSISINITGDDFNPLEINPVSGDLTLSGTLNNNGSNIYVWGDNSKSLNFSGVVSGSGKLIVQQYSLVKVSGASTMTGDVEIDEGELWFNEGGAVGGGTIYVGNGTQQSDIAKLWHSDMDGGTTIDENIIVNPANSSTKYIGGLNTSGTNVFSGTVTLNGPVNLESNQSGGITKFSGDISGSNNVIISGSGKVQFEGAKTYTGSTTISGGILETQNNLSASNITVQSGAKLEINGSVILASLTINSGGTVEIPSDKSLTITGNLSNSGTLTINSSSTGTGSLITNGTVSGTATIKRYIPGYSKNTAGFHLLSMPVSSQLISTEFVDVSGTISADVDFYYLDEVHYYWINIKAEDGTYNQGATWEHFSNDGNPGFVLGKGYLAGYSSDQTKTFTGTPNTGDKATGTDLPALTYTALGGKGFNLIGNPFASAIDWDNETGTWNRQNLNGSVYVLDGASGDYYSWNGTSGDLSDGVIPAMQGFLVKAENTGAASLTIPNAARVHSPTTYYKNSSAKIADNILILEASKETLKNRLYLQFDANATVAYDSEFDAYKLFGFGESPQLYSSTEDNEILSINALPIVEEEMIVPVNLKILQSGEHQIAITENTLLSELSIQLEDKLLNQTVDLKLLGSYSFNANVGDSDNRFKLHFKSSVGIEESSADQAKYFEIYANHKTIYLKTNEAFNKATVSVFNALGQQILTQGLQGQSEQIRISNPGAYIVKVQSELGVQSQKVIIY